MRVAIPLGQVAKAKSLLTFDRNAPHGQHDTYKRGKPKMTEAQGLGQTMKNRVAAADAKIVLDKLLSRMTKNRISKLSGISVTTLTRIDNLETETVQKSTVDMLARLGREESQ
jgi:DNA invertase Pin-like site-specific DNA recombinase